MKRTCLLAALMAAALGGSIQAALIEDFHFNDPAGTALPATANSVTGGHSWADDIQGDLAGTATNGLGQYDLAGKTNNNLGTGHINLSPDFTSGTVYGVIGLTWAFDEASYNSAEPEEVQLSIINLNTAGSSSVTAELIISRPTADSVTFSGNAIGSGSTQRGPLPLSLTQATSFIGVVGVNLDSDFYSVYFSEDGGATFDWLKGGRLDPARIAAQLRLYVNNDVSQDDILIDRVAVYTTNPFLGKIPGVPEPSSLALVLLSGIGSIGLRRRD